MEPIASHIPDELLGPLDGVERKHAPERIWVQGDTSLLTRSARVAIVGARAASDLGRRRAAKLARMLVAREIVVVSGLAEGIDAAAHVAAMHAGGRTIAVLGTPLDRCFPDSHRDLQCHIARHHLVISQFAPGTPTTRAHFPMRNRTMALVSNATVIVEAGERSGTVTQGWETLRLGKPLFLLSSLATSSIPWVQELLKHGAQALSDLNRDLLFASTRQERHRQRLADPYL